MPKAYASDHDLYDWDVNAQKEALERVVSDSKWLVEFTTLLGVYAGVTTVLAVLVRRLFANGYDVRLMCGIVAALAITLLLFFPVTRAINIASTAILLRLRQYLFIPYDAQNRHMVFYAFWQAILTTIEITAIWGTGLLGSELVKNVSLPQ